MWYILCYLPCTSVFKIIFRWPEGSSARKLIIRPHQCYIQALLIFPQRNMLYYPVNLLTLIVIIWVATPSSFINSYRRFRGAYVHLKGISTLNTEAADTSETSRSIYETTRCHNPEDHNPNFHRCENLKYHVCYLINDNKLICRHSGPVPTVIQHCNPQRCGVQSTHKLRAEVGTSKYFLTICRHTVSSWI
jgi:hypothetical protein